jgi:pimeloyl-ACP methyl ester carboxylesterase
MREKAVQFGAASLLTGIRTEPDPDRRIEGAPGVIMLNSGILHRVGACRLHVQLGRALADAGFQTLRFDFSGIGDSEARRDTLSFEESAPLEVVEAMDYLARTAGVERFVLVGLCSGADVAFHAAGRDERVVGLCQIDAWPYKTVRHRIHHYAPKLARPQSWANFIRRNVARVAPAPTPAAGSGAEMADLELPTYVRECPPRDFVAERLRDLVGRGVALYHVYSGGQEEYNYARQFEDAFSDVSFGDRLCVSYMPEADHIFTGLQHQQQVIASIRNWMQEASPAAASESTADPAAISGSPRTPVSLHG